MIREFETGAPMADHGGKLVKLTARLAAEVVQVQRAAH